MIVLTPITSTEIFAIIALLVFKLLSRKFLFIQRNLPIAIILKNEHALNSGQSVQSQIWQSLLSYPLVADVSQ